MRRKYFGLAMAAIATLGPAQAFGGDREIAQTIIERLKTARDAGELKNFNLDMKVDDGVVLFRGSVDSAAQQQVVLGAASQLDGIARVVNELKIVQPTPAKAEAKPEPAAVATTVSKPEPITIPSPKATLVKPKSTSVAVAAPSKPATRPVETVTPVETPAETAADNFDFTQAIATLPAPTPEKTAPVAKIEPIQVPQQIEAGNIQPAAAFEQPVAEDQAPMQAAPIGPSDDRITDMIASALGKAKQMGHLKSFGVDVNAVDGIVELTGKAASDQQRNLIGQIAGGAPGVRGVRNMIDVSSPTTSAQTVAHRQNLTPMPTPAPSMQTAVHPMPPRPMGTPAQHAAYGSGYGGQMINGEMVVPGSIVNHGPVGGGQVVGAPMMGAPVPMAPAAPAGAPRYDSPNLPNYAWPGYAAYPNYAALSYPQQYSPSAFPYIGPFYPYPQVPLGWRKVSLEWDDGWWFLDFTDR